MNLYKFGKLVCSVIFYPLYRIKVYGKENIPSNGPVIICSNHISNLDPPIVGITSSRDIYFMAKEELFRNKFLNKLLTGLHAFPVKRGMRDRNALRQGLKALDDGETLGLFPEGTRSKDGKVGKGLAGAGFFALRSEASVVPCAIIGPYKKFKSLKVVYGKPIDLTAMREEKASAQVVTDLIMSEIEKLTKKQV
ncbi:lysophospholipid acyltransferase family protein [Thalassobacillus hwangdonensis]|uniref:Lysophospholipid acyltransferase family protein n=1 Tax=Thalassobacillus hwangdonensis TaxID=546108 RepID=A0ABW3L1Q7_9BACI